MEVERGSVLLGALAGHYMNLDLLGIGNLSCLDASYGY